MEAACTRLGFSGAEYRADTSRVPGSGQLADAPAVPGVRVGVGRVRVGVWTPPSLVGVP